MPGVFSWVNFDSFKDLVDFYVIKRFKVDNFDLSKFENFEEVAELAAENKKLNCVIIKGFVRLVEHYDKGIKHDDPEEVELVVNFIARYAIQLIKANNTEYPTREFSELFSQFVRPNYTDRCRSRKYVYVGNKAHEILMRGVDDLDECHKITVYMRKSKHRKNGNR